MDQATESILSGQPLSVTPVPAAATAPVATQTISPPPVDPGQPLTAPVVDPAVVKPDPSKTTITPALVKSEPLEQAITDEQLLNAIGIAETPEKKLGRIERERSAEGKENRRLAETVKWFKDILDEQGLAVTENEQKLPAGLLATKKYSKDMGELNIQFKDLSDNEQALFETEGQKAIDLILGRARKALTKVMPTTEQAPVAAVSPERHEVVFNYLAEVKRETGDLQFPGLAINRKLIEQALTAPNTSQALQDFYRRAPDEAIVLLHLKLEHARAHIVGKAQKIAEALAAKKAENDKNPQPQPAGGGTATIGGAPAGDLASQVAHAPLGLY